MLTSIALALTTPWLLAFSSELAGDGDTDWVRFRGPNGSGLAPSGARLPADLGAEGLVAWRVEIPQAYSSPIVGGDKVFLTAFEDGEVMTIARSLEDGAELWRQVAKCEGEVKRRELGSPAAPSPTTDGKHVWVCFQDAGVLCYTVEGKLVWQTGIGEHRIPHGLASSPVLVDGKILIQIDADSGSSLRAFDAKTGKELWNTERPGCTYGFSTPLIYHLEDGAHALLSGAFVIESFDVATGERDWQVDGACWNATPNPIVDGKRAYVLSRVGSPQEYRAPRVEESWEEFLEKYDEDATGDVSLEEWNAPGLKQMWLLFDLDDSDALDAYEYGQAQKRSRATGAFFALNLDAKSEDDRRLWTNTEKRGIPEMTSPLVCNDTLFLIRDGLLTSMDPETAEVIKQERIDDTSTNYASPIAAGDRILIASLSSRLTLISAKRDWEVLSYFELDDEPIWATPAIAGDRLVVRTEMALWCLKAAD